MDESAGSDEGRRRTNRAERFAVRPPGLLPARDVFQEDSSSNDVFERSAEVAQSVSDDLERLLSLPVEIARGEDRPVGRCRRRPAYLDRLSHPHGPRVADDPFPRAICGDGVPLHDTLLSGDLGLLCSSSPSSQARVPSRRGRFSSDNSASHGATSWQKGRGLDRPRGRGGRA